MSHELVPLSEFPPSQRWGTRHHFAQAIEDLIANPGQALKLQCGTRLVASVDDNLRYLARQRGIRISTRVNYAEHYIYVRLLQLNPTLKGMS